MTLNFVVAREAVGDGACPPPLTAADLRTQAHTDALGAVGTLPVALTVGGVACTAPAAEAEPFIFDPGSVVFAREEEPPAADAADAPAAFSIEGLLPGNTAATADVTVGYQAASGAAGPALYVLGDAAATPLSPDAIGVWWVGEIKGNLAAEAGTGTGVCRYSRMPCAS